MLTAMDAAVLPDDNLRYAPRRWQSELPQVREYIREAKLDKMITDSFSASDPPTY
jgi:hypothetical protein